jgi:hypothetical protein
MKYPYFNYRSRKMVVNDRVSIDYKNNCLNVGELCISLDAFRDFLWAKYCTLVFHYKIRSIVVNGRVVTTFDWESIFLDVCKNPLILETFLHENSAR